MCDDYLLCQLNFFVDCPQVNALHNYTAQQPDELSLYEGDVINVLKKLPDGKLAYIFVDFLKRSGVGFLGRKSRSQLITHFVLYSLVHNTCLITTFSPLIDFVQY